VDWLVTRTFMALSYVPAPCPEIGASIEAVRVGGKEAGGREGRCNVTNICGDDPKDL